MPADADQRLKVFISYARGDLAFADQLFAALDAAGFEPMLDRHGITAGADFQQRLGAMILEADTVVFVLSPASVNPKSYTIWEIGEAERLSKRILPIVCSPIDNIDVPDRLKRLDYPFFYDEPKMPESGFGKAMKRLTTALNSDLEWLREHTRLLELASKWNVKRTPEHLLRGQLIAEAQKWMLSKPRTAPDVTPLHLEFIKASEAAQSLLDNEARQQIERIAAAQTEQAKALARAEEAVKERERVTDERDTAQKRSTKLERQRTAISTLFALVAAALAAFAWHSLRRASEQEQITFEAKKAADDQQKLSDAKNADLRAELQTLLQSSEAAARTIKTLQDENADIKQLASLRPAAESEASSKAGADALKTSSESLVELARNELAKPNANIALTIEKVLRSLPDAEQKIGRPVVKGAEATLFEALQRIPRPSMTLRSPEGGVTDVEMLMVPDRAFVGRFGPHFALINTQTGSELWKTNASVATASPDGKFIAYADVDTAKSANVISFVDTITGKGLPNLKLTMPPALSGIATIDISPNGKKIGVADGANAFAFIFDATDPDKTPVKVEQPASLRINRLIFSPDSRHVLALGYLLYTARVFDAETGRQSNWLNGGHLAMAPFGLIKTATFSPDGKMIVTGGTDGIARRWAGDKPLDPKLDTSGPPTILAFAPDNAERLLTGSGQNVVKFWNAPAGSELRSVNVEGARLVSAGFARTAKAAFVSWSDGSTELFDANGTTVQKTKLMKEGQSAAALSPDAKSILTGTDQGTVQLWTLDAHPEQDIVPVKSSAAEVAFTPDDRISVRYADGSSETVDVDLPDVTPAEAAGPSVSEQQSTAPPRSIELAGGGVSADVIDPMARMTVANLKPSQGCRLTHPTLNAAGTFAAALCSDNTVRVWRVYRSTDEIVGEAKSVLAYLEPGTPP